MNLHLKRIFGLFSLLLTVSLSAQPKHFSLGAKHYGIGFGNSRVYHGIRLNLIDRKVILNNGISLAFTTDAKLSNGLSIGLFGNSNDLTNGLSIGGLFNTGTVNGVSIALFNSGSINGLGLSPFFSCPELNGVFLAPWGIYSEGDVSGFSFGLMTNTCKRFKGLAISAVFNHIKIQRGVSIGLINYTKDLKGLQFGLLNYAGNNRIFRIMPLVNFNFR